MALKTQLSAFDDLPAQERLLIDHVLSHQLRTLGPHKDIIREGDNPRVVNVLLEGWAMRYKQLPDGRRQILAFFFPGDICDANVFILKEMDHSVGTLTHVSYAEVSQVEFEALLEASPRIAKALWWRELVNGAIQREWTTNIGQRSAYERLAHLFCEMFVRLRAIGQVRDNGFAFPLTQADLADATGMTPVHVNRTLQRLRREGLVELRNRRLILRDPDQLREVAQFSPNYLHLDGVEGA